MRSQTNLRMLVYYFVSSVYLRIVVTDGTDVLVKRGAGEVL